MNVLFFQDQESLNSYTNEISSLVSALKNKDKEILEIQENMNLWKKETLTKLAEKFELELNKELDRYFILKHSSQKKRPHFKYCLFKGECMNIKSNQPINKFNLIRFEKKWSFYKRNTKIAM